MSMLCVFVVVVVNNKFKGTTLWNRRRRPLIETATFGPFFVLLNGRGLQAKRAERCATVPLLFHYVASIESPCTRFLARRPATVGPSVTPPPIVTYTHSYIPIPPLLLSPAHPSPYTHILSPPPKKTKHIATPTTRPRRRRRRPRRSAGSPPGRPSCEPGRRLCMCVYIGGSGGMTKRSPQNFRRSMRPPKKRAEVRPPHKHTHAHMHTRPRQRPALLARARANSPFL